MFSSIKINVWFSNSDNVYNVEFFDFKLLKYLEKTNYVGEHW